MKIKCFNTAELPVFDWSDGCGASQEVFCWPVASDYSLRASIATINQASFFKQYPDGERLIVLLGKHQVTLTDSQNIERHLIQVGESIQVPANHYIGVNPRHSPVHILNFIYRPDRWTVSSYVITGEQKLPINQAGVVYILSGEWGVSGGSCNRMRIGQGGWWLPDIGEGELKPLTKDCQLVWIKIIPR